MKRHILIKELGEGVCKTICNLSVMRYEGVKMLYLPARDKEITCNKCRKRYASRY